MYEHEPELRLLSPVLLPPTTAKPLDTPFIRQLLVSQFLLCFLKVACYNLNTVKANVVKQLPSKLKLFFLQEDKQLKIMSGST